MKCHRLSGTVSRWLAAGLLATVATQGHAAGWGFTPTAREWETWPQYCRVQYSYINRGQNEYGDYYPDSAIAGWRSAIGEKTFTSMHHYCKAMIILDQIRLEKKPEARKYLISVAIEDASYTYVRAESQSMAYPAIAAVMGRAKFLNGDTDEAFDILKRAIDVQPLRFEAYASMAQLYREQHKLDMAIKIVNQANEANGGASAEVQYTLGLLNLEAGNIDAAVANARQAYAKEYPLPGLATRLEKLGRWPERPTASDSTSPQ
jgi:tetratricopeptide (TPR) repeat protein